MRFTLLQRLCQRAVIQTGLALHPLVAEGAACVRQGWRLSRGEYTEQAAWSLRRVLRVLRARGLCLDARFDPALDGSGLACLPLLPVLTRRALGELYPQLSTHYRGSREVLERCTSGSTGMPVHFFHGRSQTRRQSGMLCEMLGLVGWHPGLPRISMWALTHETGSFQRGWLSRHFRLLSEVHNMSPTAVEFTHLLALLEANAPCALYGFASALELCSRYMLEQGRCLTPGRVVCAWNTAEMLLPSVRELFRQAFGAPLRDFYGCNELPAIAAECAHGTLHVSARYILESVDPQSLEPLPEGTVGQLLFTDPWNEHTPFIRYQLGDLGALAWRDACPCGRRGYSLTQLTGRTCEQIVLPDGRRISSMAFGRYITRNPGIRQFITARTGERSFELRYTGEQLSAAQEQLLRESYQSELGPVEFCAKRVDQVPTAPSGKLIRFIDARGDGPGSASTG